MQRTTPKTWLLYVRPATMPYITDASQFPMRHSTNGKKLAMLITLVQGTYLSSQEESKSFYLVP